MTFKDRLVRFGLEILLQVFELLGVEIVVLHPTKHETFESQLAEDVLTILIVYSSKIYGKRSHQRQREIDARGRNEQQEEQAEKIA